MTTGPMPAAPRAVRLTFTYDGDDLTLVGRQEVDVVPPQHDPHEQEAAQGMWLEVRDRQDKTVHRQVIDDPVRADAEVFDEPGKPIQRIPVERPTGMFSVVVPADEEADHVALLRGGHRNDRADTAGGGREAGGARVAEIGRFSLRGDVA